MKKFLVCLVFFALALLAAAQAPQAINYQAIARNPQGQPIANKTVSIQISILNGSISGPAVYVETHQLTTNQFGLFTLGIGLGTAQSGTFATIDWASAPKFLKVNIDNTLQGVTQLLSVPYALYAASAKEGQTLSLNGNQLSISSGNAVTLPGSGGGTLNDLTDVNTAGAANGQILQWNGSQWVPVTLPPGASYTAGNGISINGTVINNTGDTNAGDDITNTTSAGGDLSGTYPNPSVVKIQGKAVANTAPSDGDLLRFNSAAGRWEPVASSGIGWGLTGNNGTDAGVNFIGTTDSQPLVFKINDVKRMQLDSNGILELFGQINSNTFVGMSVGKKNFSGTCNSFLGAYSGFSNYSGNFNSFFGYSSGSSNSNGYDNSFFGCNAGQNNTTGVSNCFFGTGSGKNNITGIGNCFFGTDTGNKNTSGKFNSYFGYNAGKFDSVGIENCFFGYLSGKSNTIGIENSFFGAYSGSLNTTGIENSFFGTYSGNSNTTGRLNSFFGYGAGTMNTVGSLNSFFGSGSGLANTTGHSNSFFGYNSGAINTSGLWNSFFGRESGRSNKTGHFNTFFGYGSGFNNRSGFHNTCVGYNSNLADTAFQNAIAIGAAALSTASNSARIGSTDITSIGGQVSWTTFSDGRFKANIQNDIQGLAFIRRLRPVSYQYDIAKIDDFLGIPERRNALGREITPEELDAQRKAAGIRYTGFIAQEVEQAARELGFAFSGVDAPDNEKDPYGLRYAEFTVPLVKAVQEQQALIEAQQIQLQSLQDQLLGLATELNTLKALLTKTAENK